MKALGKQKDYGSEQGKTAEHLDEYQYKWLMPYFTDRLELASYGSHSMAVKGVEEALAEAYRRQAEKWGEAARQMREVKQAPAAAET